MDILGAQGDISTVLMPQDIRQNMIPSEQLPGGSEWWRQQLINAGVFNPREPSTAETVGTFIGGAAPGGAIKAGKAAAGAVRGGLLNLGEQGLTTAGQTLRSLVPLGSALREPGLLTVVPRGKGGGKPPKPPKGDVPVSPEPAATPEAPPARTGKRAASNINKGPVGSVFDPVTDEAAGLAIAKRGAHLKQDPSGKYIGAPDWVDSPAQLGTMRRGADQMLVRGVENAPWYDRAKDAVSSVTGYHPSMSALGPEGIKSSLFARGGSVYSAQADPLQETNFFLKQHNAKMLTGLDRQARTGDQMDAVKNAYQLQPDGTYKFFPELVQLGPKTTPYAMGKDPTIPMNILWKTANDIRHGRVFQYPGIGGKEFSRGFSPQEHNFLHGENLLLADRAGARNVPMPAYGEFGPNEMPWTVPRAQAATWGTQGFDTEKAKNLAGIATAEAKVAAWEKAGGYKGTGKAKPKVPELKSDEELWKDAMLGIDDAVKRNAATVSYEVTPGEDVFHFKGLAQDQALNDAYAQQRLANLPERDPYYESMQQYSLPTEKAVGHWDPGGGLPVQRNLSALPRPLVALGEGGVIDPMNEQAINALEFIRSGMNAQSGGGYRILVPSTKGATIAEKTGAIIQAPKGSAGGQAFDEHVNAMRQSLLGDLRATGLDVLEDPTGIMAGKFHPRMPGADVQAKVESVLPNYPGATGEAATWNSAFSGVPWDEQQGTGKMTKELVKVLTGTSDNAARRAAGQAEVLAIPNLVSRLDAHGGTNLEVAATNAADRAFQAANPQFVGREDLYKLRDIVGQQGGWQKLLDYVAKNGYQGLPAAGGISLLDYSELWPRKDEAGY
jgi:hypothetical protein